VADAASASPPRRLRGDDNSEGACPSGRQIVAIGRASDYASQVCETYHLKHADAWNKTLHSRMP